MHSICETQRYIYQTEGVCPPEIHFCIQANILRDVRFVGGGCPGNAQLVSRLLNERPITEVLELLNGITCRNDTSCPQQLAEAIEAAQGGRIEPAYSFKVYTDPLPRNRMALIGNLDGNSDILAALLRDIRQEGVETVVCLGNLTGASCDDNKLFQVIKKEGLLAVQGELDWRYAQGTESTAFAPLEQTQRDRLVRLPQLITFRIADKTGIGFYGAYLQDLPGFSDFEPFALEINMVTGLTQFLQDESVFPALESMTAQFEAQVIVFSQIQKWGTWHIGGVDFISLGPAFDGNRIMWGLLAEGAEKIDFKIIKKSNVRRIV